MSTKTRACVFGAAKTYSQTFIFLGGWAGASESVARRRMRHDRREQIRQWKNFCAREEFFNRERRQCKSSARARHSHTQNRTAKLKCKMYTEKKKRSSFYLCRAEKRERERGERQRVGAAPQKSLLDGIYSGGKRPDTECMQIRQAMRRTRLLTQDHLESSDLNFLHSYFSSN